MTVLAIALLAHDEADLLPAILGDLRRQSVFGEEGAGLARIDLTVVPNGCSDDTAAVARAELARLAFPERVRTAVAEIAQPGKTNAWNVFCHEILAPDATHVVMLDADIRLPWTDLIAQSLALLAAEPGALAATDVSVKDFTGVSPLNPIRWLSLAVQDIAAAPGGGALCGQYYCARAEALRAIVLPAGLLSQDGFLSAMLRTDALTRPVEPGRIRLVPGGYHLHPAYARLSQILRYQKRQAIGTALYGLVYKEMERMPADPGLRMAEIARRNAADPDWVQALIAARAEDPAPMVPPSYRRRKLKRPRSLRGWLKYPLAPFLALVDARVCDRAEAELRARAVGSPTANRGKFRIRG